jgi:predicted anti-sigma-YlaC factor YlaD
VHNTGPPHNGQSATESDLRPDEVTCQQFVELVTQVEEHLVLCDWCTTFVEQMEATIGALRGLREEGSPEPPDSALAALRERRAGGA